MNRLCRLLLLFLCLGSISLLADTLAKKYPSYAYVFGEFDIDASYIYEEQFQAFAALHEKGIKRFYLNASQRGDLFLPMIREQLLEADLTDLFAYLSIIESGLSPDIESPKNAVGLWQFMPATAKEYNLTVCNRYDERCDPMSSTVAAIKHLQRLHEKFGKWYLAVMAYNCGEGRLENAIKAAGSEELTILIDDHAEYLPKETREYIKKILLAAMIAESMTIDFEPAEQGVVQVKVEGGTSLKSIAKMIKMDTQTLLKLNAHYKQLLLPKEKKEYVVTIPFEKMILFYLKYQPKPKVVKQYDNFVSHSTQMGESLDSIAKKYESTKEAIKIANHLHTEALTLDTLLLIPVTKKTFDKIVNATH